MAPRRSPRAPIAATGSIREPAHSGLQYIESSALLAALLEQDATAQTALSAAKRRITSSLTFAEAARGIVRARLAGRISLAEERAAAHWLQQFGRRCDSVAVTEGVLARAGRPFPVEPVRTLDAIHLATLELLGEAPQLVEVVTRDTRISANARAAGYQIID